ncbi:MAG: phosphomannomutase/phosphoglucomutase [Candidatus Bathyarchaeia archaeon]
MADKFDLDLLFRAYDIRGVYGVHLTEVFAKVLGRALGDFLGCGSRVVVGRDVRLSGETLKNAVASGLAFNCEVLDVGVVPTPVLYFAINHLGVDAGVMVTASHNPPEWNGFKLFKPGGCIYGKEMAQIKEAAKRMNQEKPPVKHGRVSEYSGILEDYCRFALKRVSLSRRLKVVCDTANGVCGLIVGRLFRSLGCNIRVLNEKPDGRFPAHLPEPKEETLEDLKRLVVDLGADFGVGFDGDGDRAVFVDDKGRIVPGDLALMIFAEEVLRKHGGGKVVYELSCSMAVEEFIRAHGGHPIVERVGHVYIMDRVLKEKALLGGEKSSHFYFQECGGMDDAVFASLKMAEILSIKGENLSEIVDKLPKYPSIHEKNIPCPDHLKFKVVERLKEEFKEMGMKLLDIDGVKILDEEGWILLRPSNTEPLIRVSGEAKTANKLERLYRLVEEKLEKVMEKTAKQTD